MKRRAKIICTLGPASSDPALIDALVRAGMDCARLNFSHGTHDAHRRLAQHVREASQRAGRPIAILADLCGPKMRVGLFPAGPVELEPGQRFTLSTAPRPGDAAGVGVSYAGLAADVRPEDPILLDDGLLRLRVVEVAGPDIHCEVLIGGPLSDKKGLNLPGRAVSIPALTDKDKADLALAVDELHVDYLALSFVQRPEDIVAAQQLAKGTPVIAKLEKPEGIRNLEAIIEVAEGAMVARGDLGVELGPEKVPLLQKRIIRAVNQRGKLVITATQMLDSMIRNPNPTRAEAADVANAVLDGTDALMLSGETASGRYPVRAVELMDCIIREVEENTIAQTQRHADGAGRGEWAFADAAAKAAALMTFTLPLKAVVVFTRDGRTANLLSEYRPKAPIVAITSDRGVAQRLALEWGVVPRVDVPPQDLGEVLRIATGVLVREGLCRVGDEFALVLGWPTGAGTNTLKLHRL
jgi:pyruvate kinase